MQTYIPSEIEFRAILREVVAECLAEYLGSSPAPKKDDSEPLISRVEMAQRLEISLVTLNDWKNRGLPFHKQRGRVYFLYSEVLAYIGEKKPDMAPDLRKMRCEPAPFAPPTFQPSRHIVK